MHLGLVIGDNKFGGIEKQMELLARGLLSQGIRVTVIYSDVSYPKENSTENRIDFSDIPILPLRLGRIRRWIYLFWGWREIRRRGIDLLIGNNAGNAYAAFLLAAPFHIPVVTHLSGLKFARDKKTGRLMRFCIRHSRVVISNAQVAIDAASKQNMLNGKPTRVIFNGVHIEGDCTYPEKGRFNVIFVGRLCDIKDPLTLVKALEKAIKTNGQITGIIVGDGPLRKSLEEYIQSHELSASIKLAGYMPTAQIPYDKADLFVNSSISELSSGAIAEALCHGVPVLGSRVGGNPEILEGKPFGGLFLPGDADQLAEQIVAFSMLDEQKRSEVSSAAKAYALDHFSVSKYTENYIQLAKDILKEYH